MPLDASPCRAAPTSPRARHSAFGPAKCRRCVSLLTASGCWRQPSHDNATRACSKGGPPTKAHVLSSYMADTCLCSWAECRSALVASTRVGPARALMWRRAPEG